MNLTEDTIRLCRLLEFIKNFLEEEVLKYDKNLCGDFEIADISIDHSIKMLIEIENNIFQMNEQKRTELLIKHDGENEGFFMTELTIIKDNEWVFYSPTLSLFSEYPIMTIEFTEIALEQFHSDFIFNEYTIHPYEIEAWLGIKYLSYLLNLHYKT